MGKWSQARTCEHCKLYKTRDRSNWLWHVPRCEEKMKAAKDCPKVNAKSKASDTVVSDNFANSHDNSISNDSTLEEGSRSTEALSTTPEPIPVSIPAPVSITHPVTIPTSVSIPPPASVPPLEPPIRGQMAASTTYDETLYGKEMPRQYRPESLWHRPEIPRNRPQDSWRTPENSWRASEDSWRTSEDSWRSQSGMPKTGSADSSISDSMLRLLVQYQDHEIKRLSARVEKLEYEFDLLRRGR